MTRKGESTAIRGYGDRIKQLKFLKAHRDPAIKHLRLDMTLHGGAGIFFASQGGGVLVAVIEVSGVTTLGMTHANLDYNRERMAAVLDAYSREVPELSWCAWQDCSPAQRQERPTDYYNRFVSEIERERNEMEARQTTWEVKSYIALEYRGDFAYGGDVGVIDAVKAGGQAAVAKAKRKHEDASKNWYIFKGLFSPASRRKRIFESGLRSCTAAFDRLLDRISNDLTSPIGGIGLFQERGSLLKQINAADKIMIQAKRLNADDGLRALYLLGDPDPRRRAVIQRGDRIFNLSTLLGQETVNFDYLLSLATGQGYRIEDRDIRALSEHGPYTVGGVPRQIFAVRGLPETGLKPDAIAQLRAMGVPYTMRLRWSGLTEKASGDELKRYLGIKESREGGESWIQAGIVVDRVTEGIAANQGCVGLGSILIAVNGVPHADKAGRMLTGAEVLLHGVNKLREWANASGFLIDPLIMDQETAHYAMYPGSSHLDPLERMPIRSFTMGKLLPLYASVATPPPSSIAPAILTYRDLSGQIVDRYLEVGQVGLLACAGGTGSGKSYFLNDVIQNFVKLEGRVSVGEPIPISLDIFEFGAGRDEGSSFASKVRLLGGKVIHFGEGALPSAVINPFDVPVGPGGYLPETLETLLDLLVTMCGGLREANGTGGPVTATIRESLKRALIRLGEQDEMMLPGGVRSLHNLFGCLEAGEAKALLAEWADPTQKGRYFPNAKDETADFAVLYNFSLSMPPSIRAVLFAAVCARIEARMFSPLAKAKLLVGDEVGQGLAPSSDPREEAIIESARQLIKKVYTNARRFGGRAIIAFQSPDQILAMGPTLSDVLRTQNSGLVLYPMANEGAAKSLFGLSDEFYQVISRMPKYHAAFIQGGMLSVISNVNPPLGHAGGTTDPLECELRDAMIATGKWGFGRTIDQIGVVRAFSDHLVSLKHLRDDQKSERLREMIRQYRASSARG